jgi:hypothetical protein
LADIAPVDTILPAEILNLPPFKNYQSLANQDITAVQSPTYSQHKLLATFVNRPPRAAEEVALGENQPTITTNPELFLECCEKLLALRDVTLSGHTSGAFMQADMEDIVHMKLEEKMTELLVKPDLKLYQKYVQTQNGNKSYMLSSRRLSMGQSRRPYYSGRNSQHS